MKYLIQHPEPIGIERDLFEAGDVVPVAKAVEAAGWDGLAFTEHPAGGYRWLAEPGEATAPLLVNVTPIGMAGGAQAAESAFGTAAIAASDTVFDVVALPAETPLILAARAAGKTVITGAEVIALQAAEQFERYTGVRPTTEQVRAASAFARA